MKAKPISPGPGVQVQGGTRQYATAEEVAEGLRALTDADHVKLLMVAKYFCKRRGLTTNVMEPEELLHQAVLKTLQQEKKWFKGVSLLKHLDRAMQNISGHEVPRMRRIVPFPNGLQPEVDTIYEQGEGDAGAPAERQDAEAILKEVFGTDVEARRVFEFRTAERSPSEIQAAMQMSGTTYDTTLKRIRRRIVNYLKENAVA